MVDGTQALPAEDCAGDSEARAMNMVEKVARALDPDAWDDSKWTVTRSSIEAMHMRRQNSCKQALAAIDTALEYMQSRCAKEETITEIVVLEWLSDIRKGMSGP